VRIVRLHMTAAGPSLDRPWANLTFAPAGHRNQVRLPGSVDTPTRMIASSGVVVGHAAYHALPLAGPPRADR
jgi:hypothetical protein